MESKTYEATICLRNQGLVYYLCDISYTVDANDNYDYVFTPNYSVIDLLDSSVFQGIPGLNLDDRKPKYIRKNTIPTFISERVPQKNRVDLYNLLKEAGLDYINPIIYLLNTKNQYFGDNFFLLKKEDKVLVDLNNNQKKNNTFGMLKTLLNNIVKGNDIIFNSLLINDLNRKQIYLAYMGLYEKSYKELVKTVSEGKTRGRKAIVVDMFKFAELSNDLDHNKITAKEAANKLGISIDKFYRLRRKQKKENTIILNNKERNNLNSKLKNPPEPNENLKELFKNN